MTVARGYLRVSTGEQAAHGHSLDAQERWITERCVSEGWERVLYSEPGASAETIKGRPSFLRLLGDLQAGDYVLVTDLDRLSRNPRDLIDIMDTLRAAGVKVVTPSQTIDPKDIHQKFQTWIRGAVAGYEKALIVERSRRGKLEAARRQGIWPTGATPYGFRRGPDGRLHVHEPEAGVVRRIFALRHERGQGQREIARILTAEGTPAPRGGRRWSRGTIRKLLTSPVYTGRAYVNRFVAHGTTRKVRPRAEWIEVTVPRIVLDEVFASVQARFPRDSELAEGRTTHEYLLRGVLRCSLCGRRMFCIPSDTPHYRCAGRQREVSEPDPPCPSRSFRTSTLDTLVWSQVTKILRDPAFVLRQAEMWVTEHVTDRDTLTMRLDGIDAALRKIPDRERRIAAAFANAWLAEDLAREQLADSRREATRLQDERREIAARLQMQQADEAQAASLRSVVERFGRRLGSLGFAERQEIVRAFVDRVTAFPDGHVEIRGIVPAPDDGDPSHLRHTAPTVWPAGRSC